MLNSPVGYKILASDISFRAISAIFDGLHISIPPIDGWLPFAGDEPLVGLTPTGVQRNGTKFQTTFDLAS
jgi:hypothetical protein